jgi:hypothetical protein
VSIACPLLAQSGHTKLHCTCPLLGGKRTFQTSDNRLYRKQSFPRSWLSELGVNAGFFGQDGRVGRGGRNPENIIVLSDGTGNAAASIWHTNVWRFFLAIDQAIGSVFGLQCLRPTRSWLISFARPIFSRS